ncbi:uroporphyrinogen-III C-methyltransferase [Kwoniella newhampshirensis]|uniref:precorrin-2 dehydrogenase n=1 Tax=Kwoniella newhampshirensis TaxID=1651941 RepID=A0AAW0YJ37_9TREE
MRLDEKRPALWVEHVLPDLPASGSHSGFLDANTVSVVVELLLTAEYLFLRHASTRIPSEVRNPQRRNHGHAPVVGFAGALLARTLMPIFVCVVLGRFIANALIRDTVNQIAYLEQATDRNSTGKPDGPEITIQEGAATQDLIEGISDDVLSGDLPTAQSSAALPLTFHPRGLSVLVVGSNRLAASRASTFFEAGANVIVTSQLPLSKVAQETQLLEEQGRITYTQLHTDGTQAWKKALADRDIALVCVADTLLGASTRRSVSSAQTIFKACSLLRVPINVSDHPALSTYTFPSVHRFIGNNGEPSNLQVAVSTNGQGCRLSGRIKRDIVSRLPDNVGAAVDNVGRLRARAKAKALKLSEEDGGPLNTPVPQIGTPSISRRTSVDKFEIHFSDEEQQLRRMRWVHQMSEYYSFEHLARLKDEDMDSALELWSGSGPLPHHEGKGKGKGRILLIGSGPGHPGLLTVAAHHALKTSTLILSDKLVPSEILALIPSTTKLHIAKKFPGNAEGAQNEMMELALEGAKRGEIVVRLKQGDPFVYGRGGEEVLYFRDHGFESVVIPGISSALAAPLMMGIPVTQRGVAESLVMCTGVGRQGKSVQLPGYVKSRTLVMLMGVARINQIIQVLTESEAAGRDGAAYPKHLPIGIVERASSPDQRVILSTLGGIEEALRKVEERPPGMMVVGWAALCLEGTGRVDVLDRGVDDEAQIVREWLGEEGYKIREGLSEEWKDILNG